MKNVSNNYYNFNLFNSSVISSLLGLYHNGNNRLLPRLRKDMDRGNQKSI